jgi:hypothetical protein
MTEQTATTYLTEKELTAIELPKWPGCDVDGDSVTSEQAMEILVRTQSRYFSTNDKEFAKTVEKIFYSAIPKPEWGEEWWQDDYDYYSKITEEEEEQKRRKKLVEKFKQKSNYHMEIGTLDLEYLHNERVCSCYIGGPNGWCDWDGKIHQRGKNVGKWPTATEIYNEWELIAAAFPFLRLTCRLLTHEAGCSEGNPGIAVVYEVANGEVKARLATENEINFITSDDHSKSMMNLFVSGFSNPSRERGVTPHLWEKACKLTALKQKTAGENNNLNLHLNHGN